MAGSASSCYIHSFIQTQRRDATNAITTKESLGKPDSTFDLHSVGEYRATEQSPNESIEPTELSGSTWYACRKLSTPYLEIFLA